MSVQQQFRVWLAGIGSTIASGPGEVVILTAG